MEPNPSDDLTTIVSLIRVFGLDAVLREMSAQGEIEAEDESVLLRFGVINEAYLDDDDV